MRDDLRERIQFKNFRWTASKYYDYPDGEDLFGKLSFTTKIGFFAGATFGMFHALRMTPRPTNIGLVFKTITLLPAFVAAPAAFTTVTYAATNFRKKDDQFNYVLGSIAAAAVGAPLLGIPKGTFLISVLFSAIGIAKKTAEMNGTKLFPPVIRSVEAPYYQRNWQWTFTKEGTPGWTRTPPTEG